MNDAENLKRLFGNVKNRAQFARDYKVPGGADMIYQHIHGLRPVSIEAVIAYCAGFHLPLEEISQSWTETIDKIPRKIRGEMPHAAEPAAEYQVTRPEFTRLDADTQAVLDLMKNSDERGRAMALSAVRFALKDHAPADKKRAA
jgi:hypothetical protein